MSVPSALERAGRFIEEHQRDLESPEASIHGRSSPSHEALEPIVGDELNPVSDELISKSPNICHAVTKNISGDFSAAAWQASFASIFGLIGTQIVSDGLGWTDFSWTGAYLVGGIEAVGYLIGTGLKLRKEKGSWSEVFKTDVVVRSLMSALGVCHAGVGFYAAVPPGAPLDAGSLVATGAVLTLIYQAIGRYGTAVVTNPIYNRFFRKDEAGEKTKTWEFARSWFSSDSTRTPFKVGMNGVGWVIGYALAKTVENTGGSIALQYPAVLLGPVCYWLGGRIYDTLEHGVVKLTDAIKDYRSRERPTAATPTPRTHLLPV